LSEFSSLLGTHESKLKILKLLWEPHLKFGSLGAGGGPTTCGAFRLKGFESF